MKILIALPVLLIGGTEIQTLNLVTVLLSAGYNVTVVCYHEYDQSMVERFEAAGAKVLLMKYERAKGLRHLAKGLIQMFKNMKPDIVHVQYLAPGLIPIIAARLAGVRTVFATVHIAGRIAYGLKAKVLLRLAASLCTAFFCVSKGVEEFWFGNSEVFDPGNVDRKRRHFTIYNAVDSLKIAQAATGTNRDELRASLGINGKKIIGIVGRLAHQKGHAVLLDAMAEVIKAIPEAMLLIVGVGPDGEMLRKKVEDLKLGNHVKWLGEKKQEEVFQLYGIMDMLVMPSLYEGFGLTAAEAMAAGVPVVGTRVDGLSEIIVHQETGLLVAPNHCAELASALIYILSNHNTAKAMGEKGAERARKVFSPDIFRDSLLNVYGNY